MFKDKITAGQAFIGLMGAGRAFITWPLRFIAILIGIPNTKIVYKSGHVEYYYMLRLRYEKSTIDGHITELEWQTSTQKEPFYTSLKDIESIVHIY